MFRVERLQEESENAKKDKEWQDEMDARIAASEAEKAKRAAKRNKKKQKHKVEPEDAPQSKKPKTEENGIDQIHRTSDSSTDLEEPNKVGDVKTKAATGILLKDD